MAGFVDGEGCISAKNRSKLRVPTYAPGLTVTQKYPPPLKWIERTFQCGILMYNQSRNGWSWRIVRRTDVLWVLTGIAPYLQLKGPQAQVAIYMCVHNLTKEETADCYRRLQELKRPG